MKQHHFPPPAGCRVRPTPHAVQLAFGRRRRIRSRGAALNTLPGKVLPPTGPACGSEPAPSERVHPALVLAAAAAIAAFVTIVVTL